eukprot:XP_010646390.1 PREDICTED: uncharacterized protein LOC104878189 [Vitis vinifera]
MGACSSTQNTKTLKAYGGGRGGGDGVKAKARVIHVDGDQIQEFKQPIRARNITSQNPGCFICNSESMFIGSCVPQLPEEELLQPGQIYFLMPISRARIPLSLSDLCALAIKASSTLGK